MIELVRVHGKLGEDYGKTHKVKHSNLLDAFAWIDKTNQGFAEAVRDSSFNVLVNGKTISKEQIGNNFDGEVDLVPVIDGAGSDNGTTEMIAGIALIGLGFYLGGPAGGSAAASALAPTVIGSGVGLFLAGTSIYFAENYENVDTESDFFNQITNRDSGGGPVPLVYGRTRTGGVRISTDISNERTSESSIGEE